MLNIVNKKNINTFEDVRSEKHPFHLVDTSPWPFTISLTAMQLVFNLVFYFHFNLSSFTQLHINLALFSFCLYSWFSDIITEGTFEGQHTKRVQQGMRYAMALFILSEVMFFFSFFWSFFYFSLSPSVWIGAEWPMYEFHTVSWKELPLYNTMLLLASGVSVTFAHVALVTGDSESTLEGLGITIGYGILFTLCQLFEYITTTFNISDSAYGSIFFLATGFHGFHVIVGTIFLLVCFVRQYKYHFTDTHHFGFEAAAWYWHFVDVVWLFLFITMYWWGS